MRQACERVPPSGVGGFRRLADQHHEHRDQRQRERNRECGRQVGAEQLQQHDCGHHHSQHQLRQVLGEVAVQRVQSATGQRSHLRSAARLRRVGRHLHRLPDQLTPQLRLHGGRGPMRGDLLRPCHERPAEYDEPERDQQRGQTTGAVSLDDACHPGCEQPCLRHHQHGGDRAEQHGDREVRDRTARVAEQAGVDGLHEFVAAAAFVSASAAATTGESSGMCCTPSRLRKT